MDRRDLFKAAAASALAISLPTTSTAKTAISDTPPKLKGNIKHSVCSWTYRHLSIEELCQLVLKLGFSAIDLVGPNDWHILKKYGVDCSMCNGAEWNLEDGFIHPEHHQRLIESYTKHIKLVGEAGYRNLICFSGNARGMSEEEGLDNAERALKQLLPLAEKHNVVLQMELFNSKINHPDCMADNSAWTIELCKRLDSPNFKILYDIYHMQIMEGDIIRTIKDNHQYFGHYHTAGVPGRHEIDDSQELNYKAIAEAIKSVSFDGYLAQEFLPTGETAEAKALSLAQAIAICDV